MQGHTYTKTNPKNEFTIFLSGLPKGASIDVIRTPHSSAMVAAL
jgi:hypothetical protein